MTDRSAEMIAFLGGQIVAMRRQGRNPGSNPATDLEAALRDRWPDVTAFEFARVVVGLAEHMERAERMARPANSNVR
jgi:hypothetical protein